MIFGLIYCVAGSFYSHTFSIPISSLSNSSPITDRGILRFRSNLETEAPDPPEQMSSLNNSPRKPTVSPQIEPSLLYLINEAKEDLARRLSIAVSQISLVEVNEVVWPDASLGCPQPGMAYKQVPQDGYLIRLKYQKQIYNYHGGSGRGPFLCEMSPNEELSAPPPGYGDD